MSKSDKDAYYRQLAVSYVNTARMKKREASIHLESEYDTRFWDLVFRHWLPQYSFEYITYTRTVDRTYATGCQTCLKYYQLGCLSDKFFVCIDSDYRRLLHREAISASRFVFQTYTYSIENHFCYSSNINSAFERMGLGDPAFDFNYFLTEFSRSLYELFIYHLISLEKKDQVFGSKKFYPLVHANLSKSCPDERSIIAELNDEASRQLSELEGCYTPEEINGMKAKCRELGLHEDNTYLYLRGHNLFDRVVLPLMKQLRGRLEKELTEDYSSGEKQAYYAEKSKGVDDYLTESVLFEGYAEIDKIKNDVKRYKEQKLNAVRPV